MLNFKPNKLTLALLSTGVIVSLPGLAQQAESQTDEQEVEVIQVSGVRTSVLTALQDKRSSDVIGDFVGAGDLGILPDPSIADALGRIPGVTTVRDSGQSSQLNIRGLDGDFIQTTLNGREQASTSSYSEVSRWMAFDQYPAELINSAAVYKSPKASLVEGGVAGTVDLRTVNPLRAKNTHNFTASGKYSYNDLAGDIGAEESGSRLSFTYQGKFLDETLGLAIGYARLVQPKSFESARAGADDNNGYTSGASIDRPQSIQLQAGTGEDTRDGLLGTLVYQPHDRLKVQFDYFRSEYDSSDHRHGITVSGLGTDIAGYDLEATQTMPVSRDGVTNNVVTAATVTLTNPWTAGESSPWFEARSEDQSTSAESDAYGLNIDWDISENLSVVFDISHSEGTKTRKDRLASMHKYNVETAQYNGEAITVFQETAGQSLRYQLNGEKTPNLDFNFDFTDPNSIYLSRYEEYPHLYSDEIDTYSSDFKYTLDSGFLSSVEFGVRISERTFGADRGAFLYGSRDGQYKFIDESGELQSWCKDNTSNPQIDCMPHSVSEFASIGSVAGGPDHIVVDLNGLADSIFGAGKQQGLKLFSNNWTFIESGDIVEKTDAFYLMANFQTEIGDIGVTGNIGVRHVETDLKSIGIQQVQPAGSGTPITDGVGVTSNDYDHISYGPEYSDTLPSLNLNFEITEQDVVRFAAAKVMGRPPVGQLRGGAGTWFGAENPQTKEWDTSYFSAWSKGTPYLDPFRATQFDLSYEHYLQDGGAITIAAYYKDIESLVGPRNYYAQYGDEWPAGGAGLEIPENHPVTGDPVLLGRFETFENFDGGYIFGLELAATKTFENGFGFTASYAYTDSEIEVPGGKLFPNQTLPVPGLSENAASVTAFYDKDEFSTHVNVRYRGEFVRNMAIPGSKTPVFAQPYTTIDYQASYQLTANLSGVFQVNNLTDEGNTESYGVDGLLGEYKTFGRQYYFGVNYKY